MKASKIFNKLSSYQEVNHNITIDIRVRLNCKCVDGFVTQFDGRTLHPKGREMTSSLENLNFQDVFWMKENLLKPKNKY